MKDCSEVRLANPPNYFLFIQISINPRGAKIPANTVGFFIAQSAEEVKRSVMHILVVVVVIVNNQK